MQTADAPAALNGSPRKIAIAELQSFGNSAAPDTSFASHTSPANGNALSLTDALPPGIKNGNEGLLSLKDIEVRLGADYSRLRRFADAPGIGELIGAVNVPGAKGVRYEPRALDVFRRLIHASDAKAITPATAAAWLLTNEQNPRADQLEETAIAELKKPIAERAQFGNSLPVTSFPSEPALPAALWHLAEAVQSLRANQPTAPDRLLSAEDAAALLACSPRAVSRYVKPVLPRKWKESDVQQYIAGLGSPSLAAGNRGHNSGSRT